VPSLISVFYMWVPSLLSNICWRGCLFSIICFGLLCQKSVGCRCVGLCLGLLFWSIGFPVWFCASAMLFLLLWLYTLLKTSGWPKK
jgi:hypothetical protein